MRHRDKKTEFETGAHRDTDEGKGRPSLISPVLIHRLGILLQEGAEHYEADNWMRGMPYRRTADSIIRHIFQWLAGDTDEDHLAAVCFGAMCLMTYESDKVLDQKLDDRCEGLNKILSSILTPASGDDTLKIDPKRPKGSSDFGEPNSVCSCGAAIPWGDKICSACILERTQDL